MVLTLFPECCTLTHSKPISQMKIVVANIIKSKIAAFHNEGLQIFPLLESAYINGEHIVLSFDGVERCATQFLNASLGKMYLLYDPKIVDALVSIEDGNLTNLKIKISEVRENAIDSKTGHLV